MTDLSDITNDLTQENLRALVRAYFDTIVSDKAEIKRLEEEIAVSQIEKDGMSWAAIRCAKLEAENERLRNTLVANLLEIPVTPEEVAIAEKALENRDEQDEESVRLRTIEEAAWAAVANAGPARGVRFKWYTVRAEPFEKLCDALKVTP